MEKPLHERLRDWKSDECTAPAYVIALKDACSAAANDAFTAFADEIERTYIPRPRFEDGEPVRFGDESDCLETIDKISFFANGSVTIGHDGNTFEVDGFVKRPAPKVYDADGVEIKVGDTVYFLDGKYVGIPLTVTSFGSGVGLRSDHAGRIISIGCNSGTATPDLLTHERPVFDAEGVMICKGDTVWLTLRDTPNDGQPFTVKEFGKDGVIIVSTVDGDTRSYSTGILTHREPDSLEKLRDEISEAVDSWVDNEFDWMLARKWAERLTALIERGA